MVPMTRTDNFDCRFQPLELTVDSGWTWFLEPLNCNQIDYNRFINLTTDQIRFGLCPVRSRRREVETVWLVDNDVHFFVIQSKPKQMRWGAQFGDSDRAVATQPAAHRPLPFPCGVAVATMGLLTAISHHPSPSLPQLAPSLSSPALTFKSSCLRFPQPSLSGLHPIYFQLLLIWSYQHITPSFSCRFSIIHRWLSSTYCAGRNGFALHITSISYARLVFQWPLWFYMRRSSDEAVRLHCWDGGRVHRQLDHNRGAPLPIVPTQWPQPISSREGQDLPLLCAGVPLVPRTAQAPPNHVWRWRRCSSTCGIPQIVTSFFTNIRDVLYPALKITVRKKIHLFVCCLLFLCLLWVHNFSVQVKRICFFASLQIGVSAPQGSGKTTLVFSLDYLFRQSGRYATFLKFIYIGNLYFVDWSKF